MAEPEMDANRAQIAATELLEGRVKDATSFLDSVEEGFRASKSSRTDEWLEQIARLRGHLIKSRSVIGFIGATGTGKSTLLNAILDEECVLPTSCTRACTSVVTEISYNTSNVRYRAEIEFISEEEWQSELRILLRIVEDGQSELNKDDTDERTDAGRAYSKLRALYPKILNTHTRSISANNLNTAELTSYLGTIKKLQCDDPEIFHESIRKFIEPKQVILDLEANEEDDSSQFEVWPLIRVVRIYLQSPVLKEGAVLVDLPGVHDGNAARVAITESYMRECSGIFIVTPITRAVDDGSAKKLIDDALKQQIQLDDNIGNVAVICTKTDDSCSREIDRDLRLTGQTKPAEQEIRMLVRSSERLNSRREQLRKTLDNIEKNWDLEEHEFQRLYHLKLEGRPPEQLLHDTTVAALSRKRKYTDIVSPKISDEFRNIRHTNSKAESNVLRNNVGSSTGMPAVEEIEMQMRKSIDRKNSIREQRGEICEAIESNSVQSNTIQQQIEENKHNLDNLRIRARNIYCKKTIKRRFTNEIKAADRNVTINAVDEASSSPRTRRDYKQLGNNLSVFCVSSKAYQQLKGQKQEEKAAYGFLKDVDTEIPQVRFHCRKVAAKLRTLHHLNFLNEVALFFNSMKLWTLSNTEDEEEQTQGVNTQEIAGKLVRISNEAINLVRTTIDDNLCGKFPQAVSQAANEAITVAVCWGGIPFKTYMATIYRNGVFNSPTSGYIDFNQALAAPLLYRLLSHWETVFSQLLPALLAEVEKKFMKEIDLFSTKIATIGTRYEIETGTIQLLEQQTGHYLTKLKNILRLIEMEIGTEQKRINRYFTSIVGIYMNQLYMSCAQEKGKGMWQRVKTKILAGLEADGCLMYRRCTDRVQTELEQMANKIDGDLLRGVNEVSASIKHDCTTLQARTKKCIADEHRPLKEAITFWIHSYQSRLNPQQHTGIVDLDSVDGIALARRLESRVEPEHKIKFETDQLSDASSAVTDSSLKDPLDEPGNPDDEIEDRDVFA